MRGDIDISPIVFDLETCGLDNAAEFLEPVQAAKNLVDPKKIAADIEARTAERDAKVALDYNVGRISAIGWWTEQRGVAADAEGFTVHVCQNENVERVAIAEFWREARYRTLVGFNVRQFDLRFLIQRSRYLGVPYPMLDLGRYARKGIADLYMDLTFNEPQYETACMRRTLRAFCKRFGIAMVDDVSGKDVPGLVAVGEWGKVASHVRSDVACTLALARKLGVVAPVGEMVL